jgi:hypothetical protein
MKIFDKKFSDDYWNMDVHCSLCHDIRLKNVIKKMAGKFRRPNLKRRKNLYRRYAAVMGLR